MLYLAQEVTTRAGSRPSVLDVLLKRPQMTILMTADVDEAAYRHYLYCLIENKLIRNLGSNPTHRGI